MKRPCGWKMMILFFGFALLIGTLTACAGNKAQPDAAATPEKAPAKTAAGAPDTTLLAKSYPKVLCYTFTSTPEIDKRNPKAAGNIQHSMMSALSMKNMYKQVGMAEEAKADAQTLLIKATVSELRIVSAGARMMGGAFAGRSNVAMEVELIDGATRKTVRQEKISLGNNPWAASYTGGASDHALLSNMGKVLADYVAAVNQSK